MSNSHKNIYIYKYSYLKVYESVQCWSRGEEIIVHEQSIREECICGIGSKYICRFHLQNYLKITPKLPKCSKNELIKLFCLAMSQIHFNLKEVDETAMGSLLVPNLLFEWYPVPETTLRLA